MKPPFELARGTLLKRTSSGLECYSPYYDLDARIDESGRVHTACGILSAEDFSGWSPAAAGATEAMRMVRYALLPPRPPLRALNLELTRRCTLRCLHCYLGPTRSEPARGRFPPAVLEAALALSPSEITLTGGEILLVENLLELLDVLERHGDPSLTVRLLVSGASLANRPAVEALVERLRALSGVRVQCRLTLYDVREARHDFICGTAGMHRLLLQFIGALRAGRIAYSVNFPILATNHDVLDESLPQLEALVGSGGAGEAPGSSSGELSFSSLLYGGEARGGRIERLLITPRQFARLLERPYFSSLGAQYLSPHPLGERHCRYPLVDAEGTVFSCNIPGKRAVGRLDEEIERQELSGRLRASSRDPLRECADCEHSGDCKRCQNVQVESRESYCPFVGVAHRALRRRIAARRAAGFAPGDAGD